MGLHNEIETATKGAILQLAASPVSSKIALDFKVILYHSGQKQDIIDQTLHQLQNHPCARSAKRLLSAAENKTEQHGFIGLAYGTETSLFGFKVKQMFMGLIALNLDHIKSTEDALYHFYHAVGHALDTLNFIEKNKVKLAAHDFILLPKRNQLSTSRSNLRADIFTSFMLQPHLSDNSVDWLARLRAFNAVKAQTYNRPEDYPFPIALDVAKIALQKAEQKNEKNIKYLHDLATRVTQTFDKNAVAAWLGFSAPAQNLAWNGYDEQTILGLAVHTSPNPLIKATGHMVADIINITPHPNANADDHYNPFIGRDANRYHHIKRAEENFEIALIHALETDSAEPLIRTAHNQNEDLLTGKVIGWCAHALQAAGNAFSIAKDRGIEPDQATRMMFDGQKNLPDWNGLQDLNHFVHAKRRQGFAVTMDDLSAWCKRHTDMAVVIESLDITMRDPAYGHKIAMANEMPMPGPRVDFEKLFTPQTPHIAPAMGYSVAPTTPTLGSGMMNVGIQQQRVQKQIYIETEDQA